MSLSADVVDKNILINENQLGGKLGESVHSKRRSDFSLMLAMLTDDVCIQGQFLLPKTENIENEDSDLRKTFHLPKQADLALDDSGKINHFNQSSFLVDQSLADLHLQNALAPKPIAFRDDKNHIPTEVLTNTSIYCQTKHQRIKENNNDGDDSVVKRLNFNANLWLDAIQTTIKQAPLAMA